MSTKSKGGSPGDDMTGKNKYDKNWPPKPKPIKKASHKITNPVNV